MSYVPTHTHEEASSSGGKPQHVRCLVLKQRTVSAWLNFAKSWLLLAGSVVA